VTLCTPASCSEPETESVHVSVGVHVASAFPKPSPECLLYPIQYLFLAPHISEPIDSSDSRQDNNRTSPPPLSSTIITASPEGLGWRDGGMVTKTWKEGKTRKKKEEMATLCYFLFSSPYASHGRREKTGEKRKRKMDRC